MKIVYGISLERDGLSKKCPATDMDTHVVEWLSEDHQASMWMGRGESEADAIADAERECADNGISDGRLIVYRLEDLK
jgi:hypothetical protein